MNGAAMPASAGIGIENLDWYFRRVRLLPYSVDEIVLLGQREFHRYRTAYEIVRNRNRDLPELELTNSAEQHEARTRQAEADIVIVAACGERANEVVEIFKEFPELTDVRTGAKLIERTTIIANTSSMPVAAREASVYTAMTLAEYYRNIGLKVLMLADSTSRWAQALRERSGRQGDIPGPEAFPMDTVIFTGYMPLEHMKHERPREYQELKESGKLDARVFEKEFPKERMRTIRFLGFLALGIGVILILLIIYTFIMTGGH